MQFSRSSATWTLVSLCLSLRPELSCRLLRPVGVALVCPEGALSACLTQLPGESAEALAGEALRGGASHGFGCRRTLRVWNCESNSASGARPCFTCVQSRQPNSACQALCTCSGHPRVLVALATSGPQARDEWKDRACNYVPPRRRITASVPVQCFAGCFSAARR